MDYRQMVIDEAIRQGVDPALAVAMTGAESSFRPGVTSPKGAMGLMQLMPATARRVGVTDPYDPEQNIRGGISYIKWLGDRYNGDPRLIAAGYNAGENAVDKYGGQPPYDETRNYVSKVVKDMANYSGNVDTDSSPAPVPQPSATGALMSGLTGMAPPPRPGLMADPIFAVGLGLMAGETPAQGIMQGLAISDMARAAHAQQVSDYQDRLLRLQEMGKPQDPTSAQRNYEYLLVTGMAPEQARYLAFGGGAALPGLGPQYGPPQAGYMRTVDPVTNEPADTPIPGTKEAYTRNQVRTATQGGLKKIDTLMELVQKHGTEGMGWLSNQEVQGEMSQLYASLMSDIAAMRNMGVLQPGEMEYLQQTLTDPSTWASTFTSTAKILAQFRALREQFQDRINAFENTGGAGQPASTDGSGALNADEQRELEKYREMERRGQSEWGF